MAAASANSPAPNAIPATAATTDTATPAADPAATVIVAVSASATTTAISTATATTAVRQPSSLMKKAWNVHISMITARIRWLGSWLYHHNF